MKKYPFILIAILGLLLILSCSEKINQRINKKKEGKWVQIDTIGTKTYKVVGFYKNNIETKTWRYYLDNKIEKKEKYKNNVCFVRYYYPDGKLMKKGQTKSELEDNLVHWYYFGKWYHYDSNKKLTRINVYEKGKVIDSTIIKN
ncbi:MAG: hypothetical protein QM535_00325 [Limnohabitans sp.]|nr:hypothetical protein [Limnohabitans sp.]